jgi:hypothetical protein
VDEAEVFPETRTILKLVMLSLQKEKRGKADIQASQLKTQTAVSFLSSILGLPILNLDVQPKSQSHEF